MKKLTIAILLLISLNTFSKDVEIRLQDISRFEIVDNKKFYIILYSYEKNTYVKYELWTKAQIEAIAYTYYMAKKSKITINVK